MQARLGLWLTLAPPSSIGNGALSPASWSLPLMGIIAQRYRYLRDLVQLETSAPHISPVEWPRCPSPLSPGAFARHLHSHPDQGFVTYILRGIASGFRIGYTGPSHKLISRSSNHPSALANPAAVDSHITAELMAGRLIGPLPRAAVRHIHVSPIGLVPKGHASGKWRTIVDLSAPLSFSVNDGIQEDLCSLRYAALDDALRLISWLGPGTQLIKMDIRDAYRIVPVHPVDQHLLGISWRGEVYVDGALPFGLRSAPKIFTAVADAMAWALFSRGIRYLLHYLDDFLFVVPPNSREAAGIRDLAAAVFSDLGVPIAAHKTEGPSAQATFLGFRVDTEARQLRLPDEKLARMQELVRSWQGRRSCTRRDLQSLLGHLSHAATAVRPGRLFLRRLFGLLSTAARPHFRVRLNLMARADLAWWSFFLREWNGVSLFHPGAPSVHVYSDASGSRGCGAVVPGVAYFRLTWPQQWDSVGITAKELLPLVIAAGLWGRAWTGHHVLFHVDNMSVVRVVQSLNARDPLLCNMLRCFYFYAAYFQFTFSATHIPGVANVAADALSRGNLTLFHSLLPQVQERRVPHILHSLFLLRSPDWTCSTWMTLFRASLCPVSQPPQYWHIAPVSIDS